MEDDFDFDAYETDKSAVFKTIITVIAVLLIIIIIAWVGYTQYNNYIENKNNTDSNITNDDSNNSNNTGLVTVQFEDFNMTVNKSSNGIYYFTTQDIVIGETCYVDGDLFDCDELNKVDCEVKVCKKNQNVKTECFVNSKKVECPDGYDN